MSLLDFRSVNPCPGIPLYNYVFDTDRGMLRDVYCVVSAPAGRSLGTAGALTHRPVISLLLLPSFGPPCTEGTAVEGPIDRHITAGPAGPAPRDRRLSLRGTIDCT